MPVCRESVAGIGDSFPMMKLSDERSTYAEVGGPDGIGLIVAEFSRHSFVPHSHDSYSLGVVEAGGARSKFAGGEVVAPAGSVICINPYQVHTGEPLTPRSGWRYRMLYPSRALVQRMARELGVDQSGSIIFQAPVLHDDDLARSVGLLSDCLEEHRADSSIEGALRAVYERLFAHYRVPANVVAAIRREPDAVRAAKDYMVLHLGERVTLEALAIHVALSPFYLTRLFSANAGLAPYTWLEHARVRRAAELLRSGARIIDVARETGFSDQAHLTRRFKRVIGVPPGQFARAVRSAMSRPCWSA
jgi:AraC-like DNA-binding protein